MSIEKEVTTALERAQRDAMVQVIRSKPELTLVDLARMVKLSQVNGLSAITIGEIIGAGAAMRRGGGVPRSAARDTADTRTPAARKKYDAALLAALRDHGGWMGAIEIRVATGGTHLQARKALARLCDAGSVTWKGQARATRYKAAGGSGAKSKKPPSRSKTKQLNTRSESDRNNLDQAILSTLNAAAVEMRAEQLREVVGGEPAQLRASLHRLVNAGLVRRKGRARATRYKAVQ